MYMRGLSYGIILVEAIRVAQAKYGKGKVMSPEQVRWGLEHLNITEARLKELGAPGLFPPIKTSCADHEGSGMVKFQEWTGSGFKQVAPFMAGDRDMVRKMVEETAGEVRGRKEDHAARLLEGRIVLARAVRPGAPSEPAGPPRREGLPESPATGTRASRKRSTRKLQ